MRGSKITTRGKKGESHSFRYDLPPGPDGKRQQKTETVKGSYKDTERRQREILSQIDQGQFSWAPAKITLGKFLDQYLENIKGRNSNTYSTYVCAFATFKRCLGAQLMLANLKTLAVQQAVNDLSTTMERSTVNLYFRKFNVAMKYACRPSVRYLINNPCADVIISKVDVKEKPVWDDSQSNQFIRFCKASLFRYTAMFVLLLKTGARIGEVLALRWTDVDLDAGVLHITRTALKNGDYGPPKSRRSLRKVPFDQGTLKTLLKHRVQQSKEKLLHGEGFNPDNLVFCTCNGKRVMYSVAFRSFQRYCKQAQVPYITPHGLRHTHATMLLRSGHSVNAVAERLGDSPETIMMTYGHVTPGMQIEIVKTIERLYD